MAVDAPAALAEPPRETVVEPTVVAPPPEPPAPPAVAPAPTKAPSSVASALRQTSVATFYIGNTQGRGMPMRDAPVPTLRGKLWPDGTAMKGLGSEREAYGWTWAEVQDPDGNAGWMPNNFLIPADGSPAGIGIDAVPTLVPAPAEPPTTAAPPTTAPSAAPAAATNGSAQPSAPGLSQLASALPGASQPGASQPGTSQPGTSQLAAGLPGLAQAAAAQPAPAQPVTAKSDPARPAPSATARPLTAPKDAMVVSGNSIVVSGRSAVKTRPFTLAAGSYTFAWQGSPVTGGGRSCIARLASAETIQTHHLVNVVLENPQRGETQVYGVKAGQHYVDMDCGTWSVALVPQGQDAQALLKTAPPPPAVQAAAAPAPTPAAEATEWAIAFDRIQPLTQASVYTEAGIPNTQVATGVFQRIFFRAKNKQDKSAPIPTSAFTLTDDQGRTYTSDFQLRQVQGEGISAPFGSASVVPGATVALTVTFDVATDATGLVLHMKGANSVKVK